MKRRLKFEFHGMRYSREYTSWQAMKSRCYRKKDIGYKLYGGRGIRMCDAWRNSFLTFYHDMGPSPGKGYSIDRIDPKGDYEPCNCRWIPKGDNSRRSRVAKINYEIARDIRRAYISGRPIRRLAEDYNYSESLVHHVCQGNSWPDVSYDAKQARLEHIKARKALPTQYKPRGAWIDEEA